MISEQEVYSIQIRELETINLASFVFGGQQLLDLRHAEQTSQPIKLVLMSNEETNVAVTTLVSGPVVCQYQSDH
jgi:hypothetical protein